jgi:hypothetical protein
MSQQVLRFRKLAAGGGHNLRATLIPVDLLHHLPGIGRRLLNTKRYHGLEILRCAQKSDSSNYSRKPGFTATRLRPLARRREITARPLLVFIRERNPCVFDRRRRLGWNVRFGIRKCAPH